MIFLEYIITQYMKMRNSAELFGDIFGLNIEELLVLAIL